jgi:hypothetical protein
VSCAGAPAQEHTPAALKVPWSVQHRGITHALTSSKQQSVCSIAMTMVCRGMGLTDEHVECISRNPYLDIPQNGLPHIHWPGDAEHVLLGGHDNDVRVCGAHVLSTQDHPCGTTWQATPRSPIQHRILGRQSCSALQDMRYPGEMRRRTGDRLQQLLLCPFTFFVSRIRTVTSRDPKPARGAPLAGCTVNE